MAHVQFHFYKWNLLGYYMLSLDAYVLNNKVKTFLYPENERGLGRKSTGCDLWLKPVEEVT